MGDPLGIGAEVILKSFQSIPVKSGVSYQVYGVESVFKQHKQYKKLQKRSDIVWIFFAAPENITAQKAGLLSFEFLKTAVSDLQAGECDALATAPICKEHIQKAGFSFPGHTEYLAHAFLVKDFAMMLYHDQLKVVLSTIHMPLSQVSSSLTKPLIKKKLGLIQDSLKKLFKIKKPHILVCGLNPHAGENGLIGHEEKKVIAPAIKEFLRLKSAQNTQVEGPVSADMIFSKVLKGYGDVVLCQYHDQGLIPIKTTDWENAINLTLGLPFVRTSPDHGTGFDLVGTAKASAKSMTKALEEAVRLTKNLKRTKT